MGQGVSKGACVNLSDLPLQEYIELIKEPFTVVRTDGRIQDGWQIPAVRDQNSDRQATWVASHAMKVAIGDMPHDENSEWKVFMVRSRPQEEDKYVCGWRPCPANDPITFWPTRLTTEEERNEWRKTFRSKLNTLQIYLKQTEEKQKALDELQNKMDDAIKGEYNPDYSSEEIEAVIAVLQQERGVRV